MKTASTKYQQGAYHHHKTFRSTTSMATWWSSQGIWCAGQLVDWDAANEGGVNAASSASCWVSGGINPDRWLWRWKQGKRGLLVGWCFAFWFWIGWRVSGFLVRVFYWLVVDLILHKWLWYTIRKLLLGLRATGRVVARCCKLGFFAQAVHSILHNHPRLRQGRGHNRQTRDASWSEQRMWGLGWAKQTKEVSHTIS